MFSVSNIYGSATGIGGINSFELSSFALLTENNDDEVEVFFDKIGSSVMQISTLLALRVPGQKQLERPLSDPPHSLRAL